MTIALTSAGIHVGHRMAAARRHAATVRRATHAMAVTITAVNAIGTTHRGRDSGPAEIADALDIGWRRGGPEPAAARLKGDIMSGLTYIRALIPGG